MASNKEIERLLNRADRVLIDAQRVTEHRLLVSYRRALDAVKATVAKMYELSSTPTLTEMRKFSRLTKIEDQLRDQIRELVKVSANTTSQAVRSTFLKSYTDTTSAFVIGAGVEMNFFKVPVEAIQFAVSDNLWLDLLTQTGAKLLTDMKREIETVLRTNARQEVVSGLAQGKPYGDVAKAIEQRFNESATRAKTIAFTEMHKSHSRGRMDGIYAANDGAKEIGLETMKVWKHNDVGVPRPGHVAADNGEGVDVDKPFIISGAKGGKVEMEAPGLSGLPEEDINCHCSAQFVIKNLRAA